jgi:RecA/RadA recombinase
MAAPSRQSRSTISAAISAHLRGAGAETGVVRRQQQQQRQPSSQPKRQPVPFATGVPLFDSTPGLNPLEVGALVDVVGPSGVGKTALLHRIAAHALAGCGRRAAVGVVWVDLNGGLDLDLLARSIAAIAPDACAVAPAGPVTLVSNSDAVYKACLDRLHVYKPDSSLSLLCTLHSLHSFLESPHGERGMSYGFLFT